MRQFLLAALLLAGCANKRMIGVDMDNLSGTPCIDGVIYNVKQAGCEVFYWGHSNDGSSLKLRCTYSDHANFYTRSSFYAVPLGVQLVPEDKFIPWCVDTESMVFLALPNNEPEAENN